MNSKKAVLVVDDQAENLTLLRSLLEKYYDVRVAKSGDSALNLLNYTHIDLILLDIEMPGMTGFEFLKNFQIQKPENMDVPVVFVTSHASTELIAKAISEGAKDYIVKPINPDVLYKKLDGIIGLPPVKEVLTPLEETLDKLLIAVKTGNSAKAESLLKELASLNEKRNRINSAYIEEIIRLVKSFEYERAINKIKDFLHNISVLKY